MRKLSNKSDTTIVSLCVPSAVLKEIEQFVEFSNTYKTKSDFMRAAIENEVKRVLQIKAEFAMQKPQDDFPW